MNIDKGVSTMSTNAMTAERQFEAGHLHRLQLGFLLAVSIHVMLLLMLPNPHFQPYQLTEKSVTTLVDAPLDFVIPLPPEEIPRREVATAMEPTDDPGAAETIPSNALDPAAIPIPVDSEHGSDYFDAYDRPPVVIKQVHPVYPEMARQAELEGLVVLKVAIDEFGQVQEALILESVPGLDEAALDAIYQWQFQPAMQRDVPVPVWYTVPIRFRLRG